MKTTILLLALMLSMNTVYAADYGYTENNRPDHIAPEFIAAFYDHYTVNMLNARSLSMGNTGVAVQGGIENALVNPATFRGGKFQLYMEGIAKGSVTEMNRYYPFEEEEEEGGTLRLDPVDRQKFETGIPAGMIGFGFSAADYLSLGASISIPQTIRYNVLGRMLPTGAFVDRFPSMNNYQTTFTMTGHIDERLNVGLNVIYNYYTFNDVRLIAPHFDRVSFNQGVFRFQPGILYSTNRISVGASYKFAAEEEIGVGNQEPYYQVYDTHFPAVLETGLAYNYSDDVTIALAFEYEQTSNQYEGFDDRLKLKLGIEKRFDDYQIRGGLVSIPGIYEGAFAIPEDDDTPEGDFIFDPLPYDYGVVGKTDQLLITGGFTYFMRDVDFNLAFAKDVLQNFDLFQIVLSVNIKLGEIIERGAR